MAPFSPFIFVRNSPLNKASKAVVLCIYFKYGREQFLHALDTLVVNQIQNVNQIQIT